MVRERGFRLINVDATVVMERPKLAPHRDAMRRSIAARAGLRHGEVNVKFTTNERMGWIGRGEGAGALAIATVERT